ncbi:MAG: hypothetical protein ABIG85_06750, partial [Chloroflexota bacterium]
MTDTITESFCERCGTRYSFEQPVKPSRGGIGRVRVITRGLKNYVANDGLPMTEAMAAARNDVERAGVSLQLEAFHRTFNFCMSCRQYTCANCWNEKAGECLTCAPDLTREVLPAAFPDLPLAGPGDADDLPQDGELAATAAWPTADLPQAMENATAAADLEVAPAQDAAPAAKVPPPVDEPEVPAGRDAAAVAPAGTAVQELTAVELAEIETALAAAHPAVDPSVDPSAPPQIELEIAPSAPEPATVAEKVAADPLPAGEPAVSESVDRAASARGQTRNLLARFRPGRRPEAATPPDAAEESVAAA